MSHRKGTPRKRKRGTGDESPESSSFLQVHIKRERLEENDDDVACKSSVEGYQVEKELQVRRSGRTPKAKVFHDYIGEDVKAIESPKVTEPKATTSDGSPGELYYSRAEKQAQSKRKTKQTSGFNVGYKRETRRSYQQYLEELGHETSFTDGEKKGWENDKEKEERFIKQEVKSGKVRVKEEHHSVESEIDMQPNLVPRKNARKQKTPQRKERSSKGAKEQSVPDKKKENTDSQPRKHLALDYLEAGREAHPEPVPHIRSSSRAPVPKRTFALVEASPRQTATERGQFGREDKESLTEHEVEQQKSPIESTHKVRISTRTPVPKRAFSLLEGDSAGHVKDEENVGTPKEDTQGSQTGTTSEPSHKVRSSSRTPVPKRSFALFIDSLMEKKKGKQPSVGEKESNGENGGKDLQEATETPESSTGRKRKKLHSSGFIGTQGDSPVLSTSSDQSLDDHKHPKNIKVENQGARFFSKKLPKESEGTATADPHSSRRIKRRSNKKGTPGDMNKDAMVHMEERATESAQGKSDLEKATAKKSSKKAKNPVLSANLSSEESKLVTSLERSVQSKSTTVGSKKVKTNELSKAKSGHKVKTPKHAAKEQKKDQTIPQSDETSPGKSKRNSGEASSEVMEEQEHIILKLHLPHASDHTSKSGSKKHKHKHSSESRDGVTSPKKKHHKKSAEKSRTHDASAVELEPLAKKKISLKFKGISTSHIDLEVGGVSSEDSSKAVEDSGSKEKKKAAHSSKTSASPAAIPSVEDTEERKKKKKKKKAPVENASSIPVQSKPEHVKLVIKKGKGAEASSKKEKATGGGSKKAGIKKGSPSKKRDPEVSAAVLICHESFKYTYMYM